MPIRWTHITINASDLDASVAFYTSFCGLSIVRDRRLEGRHNVWLGPATPAGEDPIFVLVISITSAFNATRAQKSIKLLNRPAAKTFWCSLR